MNKPILCLDFDGVIHSYTSGWKGADVIPDPPVEGAIAFMLEALLHFDVMIFSSRSNQKGGVRAMNDWLYKHAGAAWYETPAGPGLESIGFVKEKPAAFVTIDDRAITFDGVWPDIEALKQFKPWNKRPMPLQQRVWHPMETAPKHQEFLVWHRGFIRQVVLYGPPAKDIVPLNTVIDAERGRMWVATEWTPLPISPRMLAAAMVAEDQTSEAKP